MLRKRNNRRYNETNDEEGDGERKFDLLEQIKSTRFDQIREKYLQELPGEAITLKLIQRNGFEKPILVTKPDGLHLRVPPRSFLVRDVRNYVGHYRVIDVMDVKTQKNIEMSMKDWCKYYESKSRDRLLNVISLEFSHTELDDLVDSPLIVKLLDWVDLVWPKFLKLSQTDSTNTIDKMKYPKVQKYCLMSVKGSYTDFHIDFGGTSVWYHILRGKKIFWMVPPTELNLQTFEEWTLSGMQQDVFFGDTVEECFRVELNAGNTFFIPSGWIHAVYTLEDSLVFGGNFLHSFGIENQLKVSKIEDATKVPVKFRYPFYTEILWYVVQHYVHCLANKDHLHRPDYEAAEAQMALEVSKAAQNKIESSLKEIDDETTESEHEDSDIPKTKGNKKTPTNSKRKRPTRQQKNAPKRAKKPPPPPSDDDESTDIDSANEELNKPPEKPTINTCRMTKNSLLRLQYEIDEREQSTTTSPLKSKADNASSCVTNKGSSKKKTTTSSSSPTGKAEKNTPPSSSVKLELAPSTTNSLNLDDIVLSHEKKLNGWSSSGCANGGQSIWSKPNNEPSEPTKVHITKYEINGLRLLVKHLSKLSGAKKNLPALIRNSRALLDDCKKLVAEHENDDPELAVTGKPITLDLLKPKNTDMNELIGQFFKQSTESNSETDPQSSSSSPVKNSSPSSNKAKSIKPDLNATVGSSSTQQRTKINHTDFSSNLKGDEKKGTTGSSASAASNTSSANESASSRLSSPHKETKCLSPNKKLSNAIGTASTSSPPPRPKSPPTRPLSMNQYTSKTKNENNLLLPGSFADLIAATSTEKKVFDVSGADVASSLFGIKDLASSSTKSQSSSTKTTSQKERSRQRSISSSSSGSGCNVKMTGSAATSPITASASNKASAALDNTPTASVPSSSGSGAGARTGKDSHHLHQHYQPSSAMPPNFQKRFIAPNIRPPNKEKLIYASAPYISPVHASDPSRSGNPYPWQTPNHPSPYSPTPRTQSHSSELPPQTPASTSASSSQGPYTLDPRGFVSQTHLVPSVQDRDVEKNKTHQHQSERSSLNKTQTEQQHCNIDRVDSRELIKGDVGTSFNQQEQHDSKIKEAVSKSSGSASNKLHLISNLVESEPKLGSQLKPIGASANESVRLASNSVAGTSGDTDIKTNDNAKQKQDSINESELATKKPTKPRGPPKKSKEARQVIDSSPTTEVSPVPSSVIRAGPALSSSAVTPAAPSDVQAQAKTKVKRPKKQKDAESNRNVSDSAAAITTTASVPSQPLLTTMTPNQVRPSVICGLVRPFVTQSQQHQPQQQAIPSTATTTGSKINPQSYIISRPLFSFNSMPTFSAAQFQQMQQHQRPMNLLTAPMSTPLGFPGLQQGARIVWATQPRKLAPMGATNPAPGPPLAASTSTAASKGAAPPVSTVNSQPDNAALLSLATTALSTAPMTSSPALSHLSHRAPAPQAIMMSTAAPTLASQQQALFAAAGQQILRPFMPMPMTHLITRPGAPRPSGQLVFARLPPNQGQPRYLITQPGFMQQRFQTPHIVTSQPTPTLAFATYKPPTEPSKAMKTKKVKTS